MRWLARCLGGLCLVLFGCGGEPLGEATERVDRRLRTAMLLTQLADPIALEQVVALAEPEVVRRALEPQYSLAVRRAACVALVRLGDREPVRALAQDEHAGGDRGEVVVAARIALAGNKIAVRTLLQESLREDETRALLARGLRERDVPTLIELGSVRVLSAAAVPGPNGEWACLALGGIGGPAARSHLAAVVVGREADGLAEHRLRLFARAGLEIADGRRDQATAGRELSERLALEARGQGIWAWIDATRVGRPEPERRQACVALARAAQGGTGRREAGDRLLALLRSNAGKPGIDGPIHLYAAVGLTLLADPATAVDLVLELSAVNPNDNLAARSREEQQKTYWTVDAQLCDALLGMGLWDVEEDLLEQMSRRHKIRVLIDAHAVLRRRTGFTLPFRYNGSYAARESDIAAWRDRLRATRSQRYEQRPFDVSDKTFQARLRVMLDWLAGRKVNDRYIAEKLLTRFGRYAVEPLMGELSSKNPVARRQAALMLGRIGDARAVPALLQALLSDDADARARALEALRKLKGKGALARVVTMLRDNDGEVRAEAARFVGVFGAEAHQAALRVALATETQPATRTAFLCALLRRGDASVVPELKQIVRSGEQHDREAAQAALGERE